jgi:hypothetical protein
MAEITAEEVIFIAYREDLKAFKNKWRRVFDIIGYLDVPTSVANSMIPIEHEAIDLDYQIEWERNNNEQK